MKIHLRQIASIEIILCSYRKILEALMAGGYECSRVSTDGLNPKEAKAFWADQVAEICFGSQWDFLNDDPFEAAAEYVNFGLGKISQCQLGAYRNRRRQRHIAKDGCSDFLLTYITKGSVIVSNKNMDVVQKTRSVLLVDSSECFESTSHETLEFSAISLDRSWLTAMVGMPENLLLRDLTSMSGWGRALANMMSEIRPRTLNHLALPPKAVVEHIAALLALSAGPAAKPLRSSQRSLLKILRRDMRVSFSDSSLDATRFAHEHGISVRTLHAVFAASGTSFMETLMSMRLDQARSFLEDRRFKNRTIAEIARLVGFSNADHFSVRFRKAYGLPPTVYRSLRRVG